MSVVVAAFQNPKPRVLGLGFEDLMKEAQRAWISFVRVVWAVVGDGVVPN